MSQPKPSRAKTASIPTVARASEIDELANGWMSEDVEGGEKEIEIDDDIWVDCDEEDALEDEVDENDVEDETSDLMHEAEGFDPEVDYGVDLTNAMLLD